MAWKFRMLISGGQTGADRAALDAAIDAGMLCSGWCPAGRRAEDGAIPERYPLQQTPSENYEQRTQWNIRDSDGTLILIGDTPDDGTRFSIESAMFQEKPYYLQRLTAAPTPDIIEHWLRRFNVQILNVAGPRESNSPGIYTSAKEYMDTLFSYLQSEEETGM